MRHVAIAAVLGALLGACGGGPASTTTAAPATTVDAALRPPDATAAPPTSTAPTTSTATTVLDPELACLRAALGDRPELLDALGATDPDEDLVVEALLVARDCLDREALVVALAAGLRGPISVEVSDFQARCLAEQVLALPTADLDRLVAAGGAATALAGRVLGLCDVQP